MTDKSAKVHRRESKWLVLPTSVTYSVISRMDLQIRQGRILEPNSAHRWSSTKSCFCVNTGKPAVLVELPDTGAQLWGRHMYDRIRREYYGPHVANDVYMMVGDRCKCVWNKPSEKSKRLLHLFPGNGLLEFVTMDILEPLKNTSNDNQLDLVMKDRISKLGRAVRICKMTALHICHIFGAVDNFVRNTGLCADGQPNIVNYQALRVALHVFRNETPNDNEVSPQANRQAERFNRTTIARLMHYLAEHQQYCDIYAELLTYAYNSQVHRSTSVPPSDLILSRWLQALHS